MSSERVQMAMLQEEWRGRANNPDEGFGWIGDSLRAPRVVCWPPCSLLILPVRVHLGSYRRAVRRRGQLRSSALLQTCRLVRASARVAAMHQRIAVSDLSICVERTAPNAAGTLEALTVTTALAATTTCGTRNCRPHQLS